MSAILSRTEEVDLKSEVRDGRLARTKALTARHGGTAMVVRNECKWLSLMIFVHSVGAGF